ncbi:hypothetical protein BG452_17200 [Streptomyces sp. CBMA123]|nr:hypothetical protein [Streptomyces sp. CBMA123]
MVQKAQADRLRTRRKTGCDEAVGCARVGLTCGVIVDHTEGRPAYREDQGQNVPDWDQAPVRRSLGEDSCAQDRSSTVADNHNHSLMTQPSQKRRCDGCQIG